jgi:ubiquinone/menaquinone biosynthesis C-methylase UbiE/DNA-binding HxlR family transcriptional regulator
VASFLKALRLLGDEGRVRVLRLLQREELSVAELQEVLGMGQSRISMQLSQLKQAGFVEVRRAGQKSLYRLVFPTSTEGILQETLQRAASELSTSKQDDEGLQMVLRKRKDKLRNYFDELAGRFGRHYVPGRSWKGLAEMLMHLLPPLVIADLGAGEGTLALMLAQRAERVVAVDNSEKMVAFGTELTRRNGVDNVEYRLGDLEELPLADQEVDLALMHQSLHHALHPAVAIHEACRVLRPGGRIVVLDLMKHCVEEARELYAHVWLGFSQAELCEMLQAAGFENIAVSIVHREDDAPHFETILAMATKAK